MIIIWRANDIAKGVETESQILQAGRFKRSIQVDFSRFKFYFQKFGDYFSIISGLNALCLINPILIFFLLTAILNCIYYSLLFYCKRLFKLIQIKSI